MIPARRRISFFFFLVIITARRTAVIAHFGNNIFGTAPVDNKIVKIMRGNIKQSILHEVTPNRRGNIAARNAVEFAVIVATNPN